MKTPRTIVIGHKNPDTDSVAAAYGYADLKRRLGVANVHPACAGLPSARTEALFKRFGVPLPPVVKDVYPRVSDCYDPNPGVVYAGETLMAALKVLNQTHHRRAPVVDRAMRYLGMVGLFDIADRMVSNLECASASFVGRQVRTSIQLAAESLHAEIVTASRPDEAQTLEVYVGAMSVANLRNRLASRAPARLALVVGDREAVQRLALDLGIRLLILTGDCPFPEELRAEAEARGVSVVRTPYDSGTTIRRLKFCSPVEESLQADVRALHLDDRLCDLRHLLRETREGTFPVVDRRDGRLLGCFNRESLADDPPLRLILVDHNEVAQAVDGAEEVPLAEVLDHHRVGPRPTPTPIVFINDIVGATSTLVAEQFRRQRVVPDRGAAGVLLGGIVTDTLMMRSPTSTRRDREAMDFLADVCGADPEPLAEELFAIGSLIAHAPPEAVVRADKKDYATASCRFAVAQVEELGLDAFNRSRAALADAMESIRVQEGLDLFALLVTDLLSNSSALLCVGGQKFQDRLAYRKVADGLYDLPGVLSRKKQLLPELLKMLA